MISKQTVKYGLLSLMVGALSVAQAATYVLTASNAAQNHLLVYDTAGKQLQNISTGGAGGVSGNAGGLEVKNNMVAVVNFGSATVSVFGLGFNGFQLQQTIPAASSPVSVAFSANHLYILGTTTVESHGFDGFRVEPNADGKASLLHADGSAAQVGVLPNQLIITEKSNAIETVSLNSNGAINGKATLVTGIPANVNAPFGLITRGNDAYVTIAHANEVTLVRNGAVLTVVEPGQQMAPCWLALTGPFLFSSNSPSHTVTRFAVYGQKIVLDQEVAATVNGNPTDIDAKAGLIAVVDANGSTSHLSLFKVDEDGNMTLQNVQTLSNPINGVAVVSTDSPYGN